MRMQNDSLAGTQRLHNASMLLAYWIFILFWATVQLSTLVPTTLADTVDNKVARRNSGWNQIAEPTTNDLIVAVSSRPSPAIAGEELVFTFSIINNGPNPLWYAALETTLPAQLQYLSTSLSACNNNLPQKLSCFLGGLGIGQNLSFIITVRVTGDSVANATHGVTVPTNWTVVGLDVGNLVHFGNASSNILINSKADLKITGSYTPDPGVAGTPLIYDLLAWNDGPYVAFDVVVTAQLPVSVTYVTSTVQCSTSSASLVTCSLGNIPAYQERPFVIRLHLDANLVAESGVPRAVPIHLTVEGGSFDPDMTNNRLTKSAIVEDQSDLRTSSDCKPDQPLTAGHEAACTLLIENLGPSTARNVKIVTTLLSNAEFRSGAILAANCAEPILSEIYRSNITCYLGNLMPKERSTLVIPISGNEPQDVSNHLSASSDTPEHDPANNQASDSLAIAASIDLELAFRHQASRVAVSNTLVYSLEITNHGPSTAHHIMVTDTLPANVLFSAVSINSGSGRCFTADISSSRSILCNLGSMISGTSNIVMIVVTPTAETILTNEAFVSAQENDADLVNNRLAIQTVAFFYRNFLPIVNRASEIKQADLIGTFTLSPLKQNFSAGESVQITAVITNQGDARAAPFWVDFYINPSSLPVSANVSWNQVCSLTPCFGIAWHVNQALAPGQSITLTSLPDSFVRDHTFWPEWFAAGTTDLYLYVDSYDPASSDGAVAESQETNNRSALGELKVSGDNPVQANTTTE